MLRVLIVDDDNLVRRGLTLAMPWEAYGMKVIGEAGNGEKALDFLRINQVDLLITDLAMPVMSGIELIRIVRQTYPEISIAVLTLHQDFEYIQEALRLGAIDYIAKVELERQQFGEVLRRIQERIAAEKEKYQGLPEDKSIEINIEDTIYALLSVDDKVLDSKWSARLTSLGWKNEANLYIFNGRVDGDIPLFPEEAGKAGLKLIRLQNAAGLPVTDIYQMLRDYRAKGLFYDLDGTERMPLNKSAMELTQVSEEPTEETIRLVTEALHAFEWLHDDRIFRELGHQLKGLRLTVSKLNQLLYGVTVDWNRLFRTIAYAGMKLPSGFDSWQEVMVWLKDFRQLAISFSGSLQLSPEVSGSILSAVKIVHDELDSALFAIDVAKRVNLSRSYFNQCFKEVVGYSFNEYLRKVRIDKAREYLERTNRPITWIAEHTGYADEKYFSRIFREQTGLLPSEYRQQLKPR